jgi:glyoxylate reductase
MKVISTRRFPGPAFELLDDVEIVPLAALTAPRPGIGALIAANEPVDDRVLDLLPDLRLVANYAVGYDQVDVEACRRRGVVVSNTPGVLDTTTADLAFALLLATQRRLIEGDRLVRAGEWTEGWQEAPLGTDIGGSTLGIVGLGRIGTAVARRARGFDMRVFYNKRERLDPDRERELGVEWRPLDDLLAEADAVTLHVPLSAATVGLIDARRLALLRDGACLVNTARGDVVDEPALVLELVAGRLRAGLDVFVHEPQVPHELLSLPNVVLTPHVGSATRETREAMTRVAVENVLAVAAGRPPVTPVASAG